MQTAALIYIELEIVFYRTDKSFYIEVLVVWTLTPRCVVSVKCTHAALGNKMGSADPVAKKLSTENGTAVQNNDNLEEYGQNLKILPTNDQIKELQTILRDK